MNTLNIKRTACVKKDPPFKAEQPMFRFLFLCN